MKLKYLLTEEDLLCFNDFHHKHSKVALNVRRKSIAGFSISMFVVMAYLITKNHGFSLWVLALPAIPAITSGYFYSIKLKAHSRRYAKKAICEGKNISLNSPVTLELTDDEILSKSLIGESKLKWDAIERLEETDDYIFLYISSVSAITIPKQIVESDVPNPEIFKDTQKLKSMQNQ